MTRPFTTWIKYVVLCAVMIGGALGAEAARYIYYVGDYNRWPVPIESNAALFEDFKLYETEEGSNIYSGIINPQDSGRKGQFFSFFTELTSDEDCQNGASPWSSNRLIPVEGYDGDKYMAENTPADAQHFYTFDIYRVPFFSDTNERKLAWAMYLPEESAPVRFIVDLNNNTVSAIFDTNVLVVNDTAKPTVANVNDFAYADRQVYVPAGECSFRAYNLFKEQYYSLAQPTEVKETTVNLREPSDALCTVPNWGGGTLSINGSEVTINNLHQALNDGNPLKDWGETAYMVGSFTGWTFDENYRMTYSDGVFSGKIPGDSGHAMFRITNAADWGGMSIGMKDKSYVGNTTFISVRSGMSSNIEIDVAEELNITFEPARQAVKIWPASQAEPDAEPEGFFNDGATVPVIPKFTGIVLDQQDMFVDLTKVAPSAVGVNNLTTFQNVENDGKYQFTVDGAMNRPFRFLEFKDDKLVKVYQPTTDMTLLWVGDTAHGSISKSASAAPAYWTSKENGTATVTIDPTADDVNAITFTMPSLIQPGKIYLVGTMNGWNGDSDVYKDFALTQTNDNKYYGGFYIEAGEVSLKFFKDLKGWGGAAPIGCSYYDYWPTFDSNELTIPITGNDPYAYNINFYWEGGMVYMLVDESNGQLLLSREPIDVTYFSGNTTSPEGIEIIDSATGKRTQEAKKLAEGVYLAYLYNTDNRPGLTHRVKILRRKHTFAESEPAYLNSYTLTFADTQLTPGEDGVAETSFTFNDGVNAGPGNEIEIKDTDTQALNLIGASYYVIVDFNTGKIYFDNNSCAYMVGTVSDNKVPTYATRGEFTDYCYKYNSAGHFIELPEGEVIVKRISLYENITGGTHSGNAEATFDSDGVAKTDFNNTLCYPEEVLLHNCPGGRIFFTAHQASDARNYNFYMMAVDKITSFDISSIVWNDGTWQYEYPSIGELTLTDPATLTYSGRVTVPQISSGFSAAKFFANGDKDMSFGGCRDNLNINSGTNTASYELDLRRLYDCLTFKNVENPTVDITLSLATMNVTVKLVEGETINVFTVNVNEGTTDIKGTEDSENITGVVNASPDESENISINLTTSEGEIIVPANGDTEMTFDADGVFTDDFVVIKSPSAAMRRAPLSAGKWHVQADKSDVISFNFDLVNNKVTFVSENNANSFYAIAASEGATVTDPEEVKSGTLMPNGDGTFSAKVHIAEGQKLYVVARENGSYIKDGIGYGIIPRVYFNNVIDFDANVVDIPVRDYVKGRNYFSGWTIDNNPGCDAMVNYDPKNMMLHIDMALAGVEDVAIDDNGSDTAPVYYNLQGVRITNPESGHIYIEVRGNKARKILK